MIDEQTEEVTLSTEHEASQLLRRFAEDIKRCEKGKGFKEAHDQIKENRKAAKGEGAHVNLIHSTNQAMLPNLYAKNPDASVIPAPRAGKEGENYTIARRFSETLEIVLNHSFDNAHFKRKAKSLVRSAQTSKIGWLKIGIQGSYGEDPMTRSRINDSQDNLARLKALKETINDPDTDQHELDAKMEELEHLISSLEMSPEVVIGYGLNVDHIDTLKIRFDPDVPCLLDYADGEWLAHYEDFDANYLMAKYEVTPERLKKVAEFSDPNKKEGGDPMYRVWERWDKSLMRVFTWIDGDKDFLSEPFTPEGLGERWYPFFGLAYHWQDGEKWPSSDVELMLNLQEEYDNVRKAQRNVREGSKSYLAIDGTKVTQEDAYKIVRVGDLDVVVLDLGGEQIGNSLMQGVMPPYNPALYDTSPIRQDIEYAVNVSDAARGSVEQTKTLGEAELLNSHMSNRANERADELEGVLTEVYQYVAECLLLTLPASVVAEIAGEGAVWPDMNKEEVFKNVIVEIAGGSTTKPDRMKEQQQWVSLLPELKETINAAFQFRQMGMRDEQNPHIWIFKETLKRFDERIDIEEVLPPMEQAPMIPQPMAEQPPLTQIEPMGGQ